MNRIKQIRLLFSMLGVILIGVAIAFLRIADLGTDPFSTLNLGIHSLTGIRFGTLNILSNLVGLIIVFFTARRFIGLGTVFSILLVGNISDWVLAFFQSQFGDVSSFWLRLLMAVIGIVVVSMGASLYIAADLGVSPVDALPIIIEEKSNGKISFRVARVTLDVLYTVLGFSFGATVGISTIITSFFLGPLMHFFRTRFQRAFDRIKAPSSTIN